jgi:hypothetical protein
MQRFMALLQGPDSMFLSLVLDETLLFDRVLPGTEGGVDIHARQYAIRRRWFLRNIAPDLRCSTRDKVS